MGGVRTVERRYYLTSRPLYASKLARAVREPRVVENQLHWMYKVQLREDQSWARAEIGRPDSDAFALSCAVAGGETPREWCWFPKTSARKKATPHYARPA